MESGRGVFRMARASTEKNGDSSATFLFEACNIIVNTSCLWPLPDSQCVALG